MRIVIATGGTGGHIYPALSLADTLLEDKENEVLFIGSSSRMEAKEIPEKGYEFKGINVLSASGGLANKVKSSFSLVKSTNECIKILKEYKPDIVIGFGNYISVPVVLAAKKLKIKTLIHEQNSVAGKANILLSKFVDGIIGSYNENLEQFNNSKTRILGNPRASEAYKTVKDYKVFEGLGLDKNKKLVLIVMGSLGSHSVNQVLEEYCDLVKNINYQVLIVTGKKQFEDFKFKGNDYIKVVSYIDGLKVMVLADLVVMRSGATTCAEVSALGKASITIPSPYVPNNHQYINAKTLEKLNSTIVIEESNLTSQLLNETIEKLMNDDKLREEMSNNALRAGKVNASEDIVKWIKDLVK